MYQKLWIRYCNFIKWEKIIFKKIAPNAAFFTSINLDDSPENNDFSSHTDTADETDITCLPEPLTSLFDSTSVNLGNDDLTSLCKDIYSQYHQAYRHKSYNNLTKVTILQSLIYNWKLHKGGRITASNFHKYVIKKLMMKEIKITLLYWINWWFTQLHQMYQQQLYGQENKKELGFNLKQ